MDTNSERYLIVALIFVSILGVAASLRILQLGTILQYKNLVIATSLSSFALSLSSVLISFGILGSPPIHSFRPFSVYLPEDMPPDSARRVAESCTAKMLPSYSGPAEIGTELGYGIQISLITRGRDLRFGNADWIWLQLLFKRRSDNEYEVQNPSAQLASNGLELPPDYYSNKWTPLDFNETERLYFSIGANEELLIACFLNG